MMTERATEERVIRDLLRRTQQGTAGVVLVDGEPGAGKSRLLRAAADVAAALGFSLATGAADQLDPADTAAWWISGIRDQLAERAQQRPVLVGLDDLHWAAPATLAAVRTLREDLKRHPVAWLLTRSSTRPGTPHDAADHLFDLLEQGGAIRVALTPLEPGTVQNMLTEAFGAPPDPALAELARGAAGNPSLLAGLISGLREDRAVHVTGGQAVLTTAGRLPARVRRLVRQRLDRLSRPARHLLVTAAVLGPVFRLDDVAEMLGQRPAMLLPAVGEAMQAAIVTAADHAFTFRQELLRQAAVELIPPPARQALHHQYGDLLLARGQSAVLAASHLLQAAHPDDPASLAALDTAVAQTLDTDPQIAARLARQVLALTPPASPAARARAVAAAEALTAAGRLDQADRIAADLLAQPLPPASEDRLRCALSTVRAGQGRTDAARAEAGKVLARVQLDPGLRDHALTARLQALTGLRDRAAGPAAGEILAASGEHGGWVITAALVGRAVLAWDGGQICDGLELLRDAARTGTGISADARDPQPLLVLAAALTDLDELGAASDILRTVEQRELPDIPARAALSLLRARVHLAAGRTAEAAAEGQTALAVARKLGAYGYRAAAHSVLSVIELRRGDLGAAAQHLAERPATGPQFADVYARSETAWADALVIEARDGPGAVHGLVRQAGAELTDHPGLLLGDPVLAVWLIRTAMVTGQTGLAAQVADVIRAWAGTASEFPALTAAAAHSRGLAHRDPAALAEAAARHHDPWARASAAEDLGVLHGGQGRRDQAIQPLKTALAGYGQGGAVRDQARVRRRLRQLGVRGRHWNTIPARPVTGWPSLTGTEQAVAGLVAEGLNNGQVAARMYISPHTVAHHLRQAFRKLGIASRVELTRIVLEQSPDRT